MAFNTRQDVWYSSEPFHCGDAPAGSVSYWQIYKKVWKRILLVGEVQCLCDMSCFKELGSSGRQLLVSGLLAPVWWSFLECRFCVLWVRTWACNGGTDTGAQAAESFADF